MTIKKQKNRSVILSALFVNAFCCGGVYAWSVFSESLAQYRNWDYGQVTLAYSLMSLMLSLFGIAGGKILDRFGPKKADACSQRYVGRRMVSHRLREPAVAALPGIRNHDRGRIRYGLQSQHHHSRAVVSG